MVLKQIFFLTDHIERMPYLAVDPSMMTTYLAVDPSMMMTYLAVDPSIVIYMC
jgi:hypothetical protein